MMLFIRGVFTLVIYITSVGQSTYKKVNSFFLFLFLLFIFLPGIMFRFLSENLLRMLFIRYNLTLILFVIVFLLFLVLFTSYMVTTSAAMRKL